MLSFVARHEQRQMSGLAPRIHSNNGEIAFRRGLQRPVYRIPFMLRRRRVMFGDDRRGQFRRPNDFAASDQQSRARAMLPDQMAS